MIISIGEARQLMGKAGSRKYTDSEIEELVHVLSAIANLAIDSYIEKRQKESRKQIKPQLKGGDLCG